MGVAVTIFLLPATPVISATIPVPKLPRAAGVPSYRHLYPNLYPLPNITAVAERVGLGKPFFLFYFPGLTQFSTLLPSLTARYTTTGRSPLTSRRFALARATRASVSDCRLHATPHAARHSAHTRRPQQAPLPATYSLALALTPARHKPATWHPVACQLQRNSQESPRTTACKLSRLQSKHRSSTNHSLILIFILTGILSATTI